jgi:ATPase subunit of ABC transporter with duplicated ATPase domains
LLHAEAVAVEVAGRRLLSGASFFVRAGEKVGLVGRNGAGKTSLLGVLAGEPAASGRVRHRGSIGYVRQELDRDADFEGTALQRLLSGRGLDGAEARLEALRATAEADPTLEAIERYSNAEDEFRAAGGYSAEADARRIVSGLGLASDRVDLPLSALSGGEKRRVELGRALMMNCENLLLDEPTNHLDREASAWLMGFLRTYRGALLVVSHDLKLLDSAISRVLHLSEGKLIEYKGTYTQYLAARKKDEARLTRLAARQDTEIRRLTTLAEIMRRQTAKRARTAKALFSRADRLRAQAVTAPRRERRVKVRFPEPPHSGNMVLEAGSLCQAYDGPPVFRNVSFDVRKGDRLLVMGLNGAGKTSLLRILAGVQEATAGSFRLGAGVALGYYAQEHEGIEAGRSVLDHMRDRSDELEPQLRALMGMFGLTGDLARQDAGRLSGGEKTKLALAQLVAGKYNFLLLDEPTNNLDPPSREGVGRALAVWPGTMVLVSHDREFVSEMQPNRILLMPEGHLDFWDDELLDLVGMA